MGDTEEEESSLEDLILQRQRTQEEKVEEMQRNYDQLSSDNVDLKFQVCLSLVSILIFSLPSKYIIIRQLFYKEILTILHLFF